MLNIPNHDPNGRRKIVQYSEPAVEPITVTELKTFARIDHDYEDDLISSFIVAARKATEFYLKRKLISQTLRVLMDEWNQAEINLPYPPLISVSSVKYLYDDGTEEEYSSDYYFVDTQGAPGRLVIKDGASLPINTNRIYGGYQIEFLCGYGATADDVPDGIKTGIKIWATELFEGRATTDSPPTQAKEILQFYKFLGG